MSATAGVGVCCAPNASVSATLGSGKSRPLHIKCGCCVHVHAGVVEVASRCHLVWLCRACPRVGCAVQNMRVCCAISVWTGFGRPISCRWACRVV